MPSLNLFMSKMQGLQMPDGILGFATLYPGTHSSDTIVASLLFTFLTALSPCSLKHTQQTRSRTSSCDNGGGISEAVSLSKVTQNLRLQRPWLQALNWAGCAELSTKYNNKLINVTLVSALQIWYLPILRYQYADIAKLDPFLSSSGQPLFQQQKTDLEKNVFNEMESSQIIFVFF